MMKKIQCVAAALLWGGISLVMNAQQDPGAEPAVPTKSSPKSQSAPKQSEGERVFAQNCSRCHTSPDGFSPRISGTIVMHMRVRASLSEHDAQELLRFFNP